MVKKKSSSKKKETLHRQKKTSKVKSRRPRQKAAKKPVKHIKIKTPKKGAPVGEVTHFYNHISVAVIKLHNALKQGDTIKIEGHGKSFKQKVNSPVKAKDLVYKE